MRYLYLIIVLIVFNNIHAQSWESVGAGVTRSDLNYDAVMALYPFHGKLYIGGKFVYSGKRKVNSLACWNGTKIDTVGRGLDSIVSAFAEYQGELCIAGGFYRKAAGVKRAANVILWNDSTRVWTGLGASLESCTECPLFPKVKTLYIYNGELYAGGAFYNNGKDPVHNISKWDGSNWKSLVSKNTSKLEIGEVKVLELYNGKLYIGSENDYIGSKHEEAIVSWDGNKSEVVGNGLNTGNRFSEDGFIHPSRINAFAVYGGNLYAGGYFDSAGGKRIYNIAKWNDTTWSSVGTGVRGFIYSMAVYNGKLYVGGEFDTAGGKPAMNIAVWDGKSWSAVGGGLEAQNHKGFKGRVTALAVYKNELYAGGTFDFSGNTQLCNLAKLKLDEHIAKPKPTGKK